MTSFQRVEAVIRYLAEHRAAQPRLETLAKVAGLSPFHFHRVFTRWAGTTPKAFLKFLTAGDAKRLLGTRDVLHASLEAGLSGPGRLHDLLVTVDAVTPGEFKALGAGLVIRYGFHETPFGTALLAVTVRGVTHVAFVEPGKRTAALRELRSRWPKAAFRQDRTATAPFISKVFYGRGRQRIPVMLSGTPFQLKVWEALLRIPPGRTASYGQLAKAIGLPRASRAVGAAVGSNALAYLIPCHRVLRGTGALGGYRWGAGRKRVILAWESVRASRP